MNPARANSINGLILVLFGFFAYFTNPSSNNLELIPPIAGILFLAATPVLAKKATLLYFSIIGLTILVAILLVQNFINALKADSDLRMVSRIVTMLFSCIVSAFVLVKYYLDNRWKM
jgi:membrane-bound ClpP family serine protease